MAKGYEKFKRKEEKKKKKYEERSPEKVKKDYEKKAKKERIEGKKNQMAHSKRTKYRGIMHYEKDDKLDRLTYKYLRKADKLELKAIKKDWSREKLDKARGHLKKEDGKFVMVAPKNPKLKRLSNKIEKEKIKRAVPINKAKGGKVGDSIKTYSHGGYVEGE